MAACRPTVCGWVGSIEQGERWRERGTKLQFMTKIENILVRRGYGASLDRLAAKGSDAGAPFSIGPMFWNKPFLETTLCSVISGPVACQYSPTEPLLRVNADSEYRMVKAPDFGIDFNVKWMLWRLGVRIFPGSKYLQEVINASTTFLFCDVVLVCCIVVAYWEWILGTTFFLK